MGPGAGQVGQGRVRVAEQVVVLAGVGRPQVAVGPLGDDVRGVGLADVDQGDGHPAVGGGDGRLHAAGAGPDDQHVEGTHVIFRPASLCQTM